MTCHTDIHGLPERASIVTIKKGSTIMLCSASPLSVNLRSGLYCFLVGLALMPLAPAAFAQNASSNSIFDPFTFYAVDLQPTMVTVGDFNNDGKLDIVAAINGGSNFQGVNVLLNNGDGTFGASTEYPTRDQPQVVAVGDFNKDGNLDLAVACLNGRGVDVLLGNGDGTFRNYVHYNLGAIANCVAVGDFNKDGNPDLVVGIRASGTASVLLGKGDGTFGTPVRYTMGQSYPTIGYEYASWVVVGDVNGDGNLDFVTANGAFNTISVVLGKGDGTFQPPLIIPNGWTFAANNYGLGTNTEAIALADVNGDHKLDLLTTDSNRNKIGVFMGNGDGTFAASVEYPCSYLPSNIYVGDVNGDGKSDVMVNNYNALPSAVTVLLGNGDGTFQPPNISPITPDTTYAGLTTSAVLGDFNGDGKMDVAATNWNGLSVLLSNNNAEVSGRVLLDGIVSTAAAQTVHFELRPNDGTASIKRDLDVLPDGTFRLFNIPRKSYTLHSKGDKYLAANVGVSAAGGNVSGVTAALLSGDATNDNVVDIGDFGVLVNAYGGDVNIGGSGYDLRADFNGDGVVDIADFGLLVNNYGNAGAL